MACAHRKLSQPLCSAHQPEGSQRSARSAPEAASGAEHSYSIQGRTPSSNPAPCQNSLTSPLAKTTPGINHPPRRPRSGGEGAGGVATRGDSGGLQHPAGTAGPGPGWREATGANPREKEECQQTRRPAGHMISATGAGHGDKPRQGQPGVRPRRRSRSGHPPRAPHPPALPFQCCLHIFFLYIFGFTSFFYKKTFTNGKENLPRYQAGLNNQSGKKKKSSDICGSQQIGFSPSRLDLQGWRRGKNVCCNF